MSAPVSPGEILAAPSPAGGWLFTVFSVLLAVFIGTGGAHLVRRRWRRVTPELTMLLDESAAFYSRWPEDHLARAPRRERAIETARCQRIIELLQARTAADGSDWRGPIEGLRAWLRVLRTVPAV
jgi:hypothetical protein